MCADRSSVVERTDVATIIGLCGSPRRTSFNLMLLQAAVDAAPPGTSIEIESVREIPLYDGDVEDEQDIPLRLPSSTTSAISGKPSTEPGELTPVAGLGINLSADGSHIAFYTAG